MGTYGTAGLGLLGDPTRRAIFELLAQRPRSVGELARELPVSRPAVSQHLRALKDAGLVIDRAEGTRRIYQVNPAGVAALRAYLDRVWADALAAFQRAAEAAHAAATQEHPPGDDTGQRRPGAGAAPTTTRTPSNDQEEP